MNDTLPAMDRGFNSFRRRCIHQPGKTLDYLPVTFGILLALLTSERSNLR
jgi:hypothetical protein